MTKPLSLAELRKEVLELLHKEGPTKVYEIEEYLGVAESDVVFAIATLKAQGRVVYRTYQGWEFVPADKRTDAEKMASIREIISEARSQISACAAADHEGLITKVGGTCPKCNETGYYAYAEIYKLVS